MWPGSGIWKSCFLLFNLISQITCQPSGMSLWTSEALCLSKRWTISWLCLVALHAADKTTEILTVCLTKSSHFYHLALIFLKKKNDDILALGRRKRNIEAMKKSCCSSWFNIGLKILSFSDQKILVSYYFVSRNSRQLLLNYFNPNLGDKLSF